MNDKFTGGAALDDALVFPPFFSKLLDYCFDCSGVSSIVLDSFFVDRTCVYMYPQLRLGADGVPNPYF